jgi:hypothetical protein
MYDADAIVAINFEQLATLTDRLLIRGVRVSRRRRSIPSLVQARARPGALLARGSQPRLAPSGRAAAHAQWISIRVVIPTLVGIAIGLAAML